MAQLTIKVNGYAYSVGCEDGQEPHLRAMADQVETRVAELKALGGQSGEAKLLLLAALMMADELYDLRVAMDGPGPGEVAAPPPDAELSRRVAQLARRAEEIAAALERP